MKLAMRLPEKGRAISSDCDPRESSSAEIIDLASRTAYPVVANRKGRSDSLGLVAGIAVVAVLGAATLWSLNASRVEAPTRTNPLPAQAPAGSANRVFQPTTSPLRPGQPMAAAVPDPQPGPAPAPVFAHPPAIQAAPAGNPYAAPAVVFDASALPVPVVGMPTSPQANSSTGNAAGSDFASRIGGVGGGVATARSDVDPKTTVTQGTMIPAVLETAINTDVPGFVRALVSQDVRSFDGSRVLIPRSSRLIGQYQSGLQAGQKRAYVIWTRLIRPDGVSVALASPASGFDGSGGLPGQVDSHFFQRFGSALLLSVIGGLTGVASGGASLVVSGGQSAASTAVQQNGQIGPTVRVRMGEPIRVFTARDLDFSQAPRL